MDIYHNHRRESRSGSGLLTIPMRRGLTLVELLVVIAIIVVLIALMLPVMRSPREPARRGQCRNHLRQIAHALINYERKHGQLPPAYTTDADGKPLHSWRTLILPYLDQQDLYDSIDLTKPWDDPVNAAAFKTKIDAYQCPSVQIPNEHTTYLAIVTSDSALRPKESVRLSDIADGAAKTMLVIEVNTEQAVPWMAPSDADEEYMLAPQAPMSRHPRIVNATFADGHVEAIRDDISVAARRALISIAGNDNAALGDSD
jgi:prepilin-type N-terminal cleavage/methylation domain-containing protein/prepilin-type processing-associated H-X9-DG protein